MAVLNYKDPAQGFIPVMNDGMPIGAIINFPGGASVPTGWLICDGNYHSSSALQAILGSPYTPNLQDRFLVAAGTAMPAKSAGGLATVQLTGAQTGTPAHTHTASSVAHNTSHSHTFTTTSVSHNHGSTHKGNRVRVANMSNDESGQWIGKNQMEGGPTDSKAYDAGSHSHGTETSTSVGASHTHTVTPANTTAVTAASSHTNLPPYYAMVYIIRAA